jgi:hypothetical protein
MATAKLSQPFSVLAAADWRWDVTAFSARSITISNGNHKQTFAGSFSESGSGVSGTLSAGNDVEDANPSAHDSNDYVRYDTSNRQALLRRRRQWQRGQANDRNALERRDKPSHGQPDRGHRFSCHLSA